ncbi:hypothetical protein KEM54_004523, partial [Ascosphaera aggregata]
MHQHKQLLAEDRSEEGPGRISTPEVNNYLKMTDPDEKTFPTLRSDRLSGLLSANPVALDLANAPAPIPQPETERTGFRRTVYNRDRSYHQSISLPSHSLNFNGSDNNNETSSIRPISTESTQLPYDPFLGNQTQPRQQAPFSSAKRTRAHTTMNDNARVVTPPTGHREPAARIASPISSGIGFEGVAFSPERNGRQSSVSFNDGPGSPISARDETDVGTTQPLPSSLQVSAAPFGGP